MHNFHHNYPSQSRVRITHVNWSACQFPRSDKWDQSSTCRSANSTRSGNKLSGRLFMLLLTLTVCTCQVSTATLAHLTFYVPVWQPPIWTEMRMAQLMPLPLTVSCFSKIQFGFTFLVPGQRAIQQVCMLPFFNILFQHQEKSSCKPININTRYFT